MLELHPELKRITIAELRAYFLLPAPDLEPGDLLTRSFFYDTVAFKLVRRGEIHFLLDVLPSASAPQIYAILSALDFRWEEEPGDQATLFSLLDDARPHVVARAIGKLRHVKNWNNALWARIEPLLSQPHISPWVKTAVLRFINNVYGPFTREESLPYLLTALRDPDAIVRLHTLYELEWTFFSNEQLYETVQAAISALLDDAEPEVRIVARAVLLNLQQRLGKEAKRDYAWDADLRTLEVAALIDLFSEPEPLYSLYEYDDHPYSIYYNSIASVLSEKGEAAILYLKSLMPITDMRRLGSILVALSGNGLTLTDLLAYTTDERPIVQAATLLGIRRLKATLPLPDIQAYADHPSPLVRSVALNLASHSYPLHATTLARKGLRDPHCFVRQQAASVLGHLSVQEATHGLRALLHDDPNGSVRLSARFNMGVIEHMHLSGPV
ncbi:HEAT repeat domain-containing protein [Dictyobacter kobayashii]|uniref:HEAT repeat domain-containing protein n=1 Tax=Dictyobacter kobayashii TaxID=2014872 RepID=A0A402AXQ5_9CHLR|nr:hypothetical protein [Dictyobacter kobayashii]GCE23849.1 hypothetical protein KDK_76490 [Dictyobacter kobayashii]